MSMTSPVLSASEDRGAVILYSLREHKITAPLYL